MSILLILIMVSSITFIFMNHPVSMSLLLLFQTIAASLMVGLMIMDFWFSYIMFLAMIGGLLVLFLYMTNVASNEKFELMKTFKIFINSSIMALLLFTLIDPFFKYKEMMTSNNLDLVIILKKFYSWPFSLIIMVMMIYLLISMIMSVKISSPMMGPLRKMN